MNLLLLAPSELRDDGTALLTGRRHEHARAPSKVYMTNTFVPVAPATVVVTPAISEAAVGDTVTYEMTVPATPVNAALNNISITDTLDSRLI